MALILYVFQVLFHKRLPPSFSFGIRHTQFMCPLIVEDLYITADIETFIYHIFTIILSSCFESFMKSFSVSFMDIWLTQSSLQFACFKTSMNLFITKLFCVF